MGGRDGLSKIFQIVCGINTGLQVVCTSCLQQDPLTMDHAQQLIG